MGNTFAQVDAQHINQENQNKSLVTKLEKHAPLNDNTKTRCSYTGSALINQYFSTQLLAAMGMPTPAFELLRFEDDESKQVNMDAVNITRENSEFDIKAIVAGKSKQFKADNSIMLGPLAELIINKSDNASQSIVNQNDRLYRLNGGSEAISVTQVDSDDIQRCISKIEQDTGLSVDTLLAFKADLQDLVDSGLFNNIMQNTRVSSTPEFMQHKEHIDNLAKTLKANINKTIDYIYNNYSKELRGFYNREANREVLADKVIADSHLPKTEVTKRKSELMQDFRTAHFNTLNEFDADFLDDKTLLELVDKVKQNTVVAKEEVKTPEKPTPVEPQKPVSAPVRGFFSFWRSSTSTAPKAESDKKDEKQNNDKDKSEKPKVG